jgi:hypothetical protein
LQIGIFGLAQHAAAHSAAVVIVLWSVRLTIVGLSLGCTDNKGVVSHNLLCKTRSSPSRAERRPETAARRGAGRPEPQLELDSLSHSQSPVDGCDGAEIQLSQSDHDMDMMC